MKETEEQRKERKGMYISYVLSKAKGMVDEEELIKEAEEKFEKENS